MVTCYISLGSNIGRRRHNIEKALKELSATPGIRILKVSGIYETEPEGALPQRKFMNCCAKINVSQGPFVLLRIFKNIEKKMGRKKSVRFGPRIIDLDILFYGDRKIDRKHLKIPHPRMMVRDFVLMPLSEII